MSAITEKHGGNTHEAWHVDTVRSVSCVIVLGRQIDISELLYSMESSSPFSLTIGAVIQAPSTSCLTFRDWPFSLA